MSQYRIVDIICDNAGNTDFSGGEGFKSFIEVLQGMGIRIRGTTYDEKKDDEFLTRIQEALFVPEGKDAKLLIVDCNPGIVRDIENVAWKQVKGTETYQPKLEIGNKDYLACLKYALAANLTYDNSSRRKQYSYQARSSFMGNPSNVGRLEANWKRKDKDDDSWDDF